MAGKWAKFRGKLEVFQLEGPYKQKVDDWKVKFLGTKDAVHANVAMLAKEFAKRKETKDTLEDKLYQVNLELEGLSQLIVDVLTGEGQEKVSLISGATVYLNDGIYPSVQDKSKLRLWIVQTHQEDVLTLNAQTLKGMVGSLLTNGEPVMPGVKLFLKTQARLLRPGGKDED